MYHKVAREKAIKYLVDNFDISEDTAKYQITSNRKAKELYEIVYDLEVRRMMRAQKKKKLSLLDKLKEYVLNR